jgi:hypothetical protein
MHDKAAKQVVATTMSRWMNKVMGLVQDVMDV